jgi:putative redox protein
VVPYEAELKLETPEEVGLRFEGVMGPKRLKFDSNGDPALPSPVDALLMSLAACAGMDVISMLRKARQNVTGYTLRVNGDRRDEHPRIFTRIEVVHQVYGHGIKESTVRRAVDLSDTKYCSVHAMLENSVKLECRYEIFDADTSDAAS